MGLFKTKQAGFFEIDEKPMKCLICGHDKFWERTAQLNTPVTSLFGVAWANQSGICLVCEHCGYIHWFLANLLPKSKKSSEPRALVRKLG